MILFSILILSKFLFVIVLLIITILKFLLNFSFFKKIKDFLIRSSSLTDPKLIKIISFFKNNNLFEIGKFFTKNILVIIVVIFGLSFKKWSIV